MGTYVLVGPWCSLLRVMLTLLALVTFAIYVPWKAGALGGMPIVSVDPCASPGAGG